MVHDSEPTTLPLGLPEPVDDGAADHLPGLGIPDVTLPATDDSHVALARLGLRRTVVYAYPRTGRPGTPELADDWDHIPGARGCTPESCGFRDHHSELAQLDVDVYGLSTQDTDYQREAVSRLRLPFPLLSDSDLRLAQAMRLPTFSVAGQVLIKRLTLLILDARVERVWYPVFPPHGHAEEVVKWLREHS